MSATATQSSRDHPYFVEADFESKTELAVLMQRATSRARQERLVGCSAAIVEVSACIDHLLSQCPLLWPNARGAGKEPAPRKRSRLARQGEVVRGDQPFSQLPVEGQPPVLTTTQVKDILPLAALATVNFWVDFAPSIVIE
jgi:hypothetical protein